MVDTEGAKGSPWNVCKKRQRSGFDSAVNASHIGTGTKTKTTTRTMTKRKTTTKKETMIKKEGEGKKKDILNLIVVAEVSWL